MRFAIKTEIHDVRATSFAFTAQKTMYGGKGIAEGDVIFMFASENEGGSGLIGRAELKPFSNWKDGRPETELNFKFYRQATNKIVGVSENAAKCLQKHCGRG